MGNVVKNPPRFIEKKVFHVKPEKSRFKQKPKACEHQWTFYYNHPSINDPQWYHEPCDTGRKTRWCKRYTGKCTKCGKIEVRVEWTG